MGRYGAQYPAIAQMPLDIVEECYDQLTSGGSGVMTFADEAALMRHLANSK